MSNIQLNSSIPLDKIAKAMKLQQKSIKNYSKKFAEHMACINQNFRNMESMARRTKSKEQVRNEQRQSLHDFFAKLSHDWTLAEIVDIWYDAVCSDIMDS